MRSESLKKAQANYNLNHDRIYLYLQFGTLAKIDKLGYKNRSDFIRQAINEKIERESKKGGTNETL